MGDRLRSFSGIQPTGDIHLGNYLGAVKHWAESQDRIEGFYCIVDLHAMTMPWDPKSLADQTLQTAAILLACGLDPDRSVIFVQSHVLAHPELAWILSCVARMGELRRMVQFKEKSRSEGESVSVALLTYPVLQAADVLLYKANGVPVGEDQRQHIELMRDLAIRFNNTFGETFVVPEAWVPPAGARIMSLDDPTEKMSKSIERPGSKILVIDPVEVILKKFKSAVTDSGRDVVAGPDKPALTNLLTIYSVAEGTSIEDLERRFEGSGYGDFKVALGEAVAERLRPVRERYEELRSDPAELSRILGRGAEQAAEVADKTMADVRSKVGLLSPP
jgi:tryptophanyl-tRNA synthetase